jgi:hypothetical protein
MHAVFEPFGLNSMYTRMCGSPSLCRCMRRIACSPAAIKCRHAVAYGPCLKRYATSKGRACGAMGPNCLQAAAS